MHLGFRKFVIIGGGPCGLGAALRLQQLGVGDWAILEKKSYVGGLSASFRNPNGFTWDIGGHVLFSHYEAFDKSLALVMNSEDWLTHERESWVRIHERFVPYPFQLNIHRLDPDVVRKCVDGLRDRKPCATPRDFAQWIEASFGTGLADLFMTPYNHKVWAWPTSKLAVGWVGERVAPVDLERVLRNIELGQDDVSWGPNSTFRFPKTGGTGAIWTRLAQSLPQENIRLGCGVSAIDTDKRELTLDTGETLRYEHLLSTMPLSTLAKLCAKADLVKSTAELKYSSTHTVGVGLDGQPPAELATKCWMYFPEENCPFYRVTHFSHYSPQNVPHPGRQWSLMAEVSESEHKPESHCADTQIRASLAGLRNTGMIQPDSQILSTYHQRVEFGYPTPTANRDDIVMSALDSLAPHGIYSRGRFGAWRYEVGNMDHSFMQGYEWAEYIINNASELTLYHPEIVNAPKP